MSWLRPVAEVLREMPRPVRIENRVFIDVRTSRLVIRQAERAASVARRLDGPTAPLVIRLLERAERDAPTADERSAQTRVADAAHAQIQPPRHPAVPPVAPVAMVLARPGVSAGPIPARGLAVPPGWGSAPGNLSRPSSASPGDRAPLLSPSDVTHLTDRVVAAIDRRMVATRERLGL
jgi:hypothetical protein